MSNKTSKDDSYEIVDEVEWASLMQELGYDDELFMLPEEGRGVLYESPTDQLSDLSAILSRQSGPRSAARSFSNDLKYLFRCPDSPPTQTGISFVVSLML